MGWCVAVVGSEYPRKESEEVMAHTPGPWKVVDRFYVWTDDDVSCEVAKVCDENLDDDMLAQADADARLIAAAPGLLAALKDCVEWLESVPLGDAPQRSVQNARSVIAKAEGRS